MLMKATFPAVAASLRQDSGTSSPATHENLERYRLLVVGDNGCGKTCLLKSFVKSDFEVDDTSSDIFEECMETVRIGTRRIEFMLCDLSGQEEYDGLRIELYHNADVFLVCFDIGNPNSLTNIDDTWIPEIKDEAPNIPFIVVGCKNDLRTDSNLSYYLAVPGTQSVPESSDSVNRIKAEKVAIDSGAKDYIECCARTGFNISHVFQSAANAVLWEQVGCTREGFKKRISVLNQRKVSKKEICVPEEEIFQDWKRFLVQKKEISVPEEEIFHTIIRTSKERDIFSRQKRSL
eukprot:gene552-1209_t